MKIRNICTTISKVFEVLDEEADEVDIATKNKAQTTPALLKPIVIFEKEKVP